MILVILGICILFFIIAFVIGLDDDGVGDLIGGASFIGIIISIIVAIVLTVSVSKSVTIDEKIAMYETENKNIEATISVIVENYQDYEKEIFNNAKPENFIAIATQIYPDLKSNELVKKQINIYVENNKKIKEFKEDKINYKVKKWWLYFGGNE